MAMIYTVKAGKLIITVDVNDAALKSAPPSASGKSRVVATSQGFQKLEGSNVAFALNVITK